MARLLGPHHATICDCVYAAQVVMREHVLPLIPTGYPRAKRNMMSALIAEEVRRRFAAVPGVGVFDAEHQRFLVQIGTLLLRFKHVTPDLRTANYPTQAALNFDRQIEMEGIPKGARITVGYLLDKLETAIEAVFVIFKFGRWVEWYYEIGADASARGVEVIPIAPDFGERRITARRPDPKGKAKPETE